MPNLPSWSVALLVVVLVVVVTFVMVVGVKRSVVIVCTEEVGNDRTLKFLEPSSEEVLRISRECSVWNLLAWKPQVPHSPDTESRLGMAYMLRSLVGNGK